MLTPDQALRKIFAACEVMPTCKVDIRTASGLVLASNIYCPDSLPRFNNSAVDGFALRSMDIRNARGKKPVHLRLVGEVHAGSAASPKIRLGEAVRVSTGARIPTGADAVVMQEDCGVYNGKLMVKIAEARWNNIRRRGEEIQKGQIALRKGTRLNPGSLAWLSTMGIKKVSIYRPLKVGLLRSGNEVVDLQKSPRPYQVRDAHGISIPAALKMMGLETKIAPIVCDDLDAIVGTWRKLLAVCDVVITTGGVSVGERDFFHEAARKLGLKTIFQGVSQKPGKPLAFGKKGSKLWFGLPGNPVSSLVCFYIYIQPALLRMMGINNNFSSEWIEARAAHKVCPDFKRTSFLRGYLQNGSVSLAEKQGSHCLSSFSHANVLVRLNPIVQIQRGAKVCCLRLPW